MPNADSSAAGLLEAAHRVAPLAMEHADEGEAERRLARPVVDALVDAGLLRLCLPAAYGGPEVDPVTMVQVIETVARADGAAGWCVMIASTTASMSCFLEPAYAKEVFGDPASVAGGVYAPNGRAEEVEGGWRVTGQWPWGSGTTHCQWISGGAITTSGEFHLMFAPAEQVELLDTWWSMGLKGTGSTDFRMTDVFVPRGRTVQPGVSRPQVDSPLARFPNFNLLAAGVAATTLGMARRAIDEVIALAQGKTPLFSSRTLAKSAMAQFDVARAEASYRGAKAYLLDALGAAWDTVVAGDDVSMEQRTQVRLACAHAAAESARAVDLAYHLGGGSSVFLANPLQRCFRDVHTATQHLMVAPRIMETAGKLLLGVEADTTGF